MNIPNKLCVLRILLVPVVIYIMINSSIDNSNIYALLIFVIASLTDMLDGYIARKYNMITNLGKFLDPLADKVLVISVLIAFVQMDKLSPWIVIIIVFREFAITGFRILAASENIIIAASWWGKIKTITQMIMIIILFLNLNILYWSYVEKISILVAVFMTIISGIDYIIKNKKVLEN